MPVELPAQENRRAPRLPTDFWVMVQGVDDQLVHRRGNISASGIIFGADGLDLDLGSLEYLHLASPDRKSGVMVMAQVARIVVLQGHRGGPKKALAFEFLPENVERRQELHRFVEKLAAKRSVAATLQPARGQVLALEIPSLQFETTWPVDVGDRVQIVLGSAGGATRIPFEGQVQAVSASAPGQGPTRYHVEATPMRAGQRAVAAEQSITESIDIVMAELMAAGQTVDLQTERPHLKGRLDHISLATVLSWFDVGRLSGRLRVQGPDSGATLYLRDGSLIDVDGFEGVSPIEALGRVLGWREGRFELHEGDVSRPDRVQTSMPALLIELARQSDESEGEITFVA